MKVALIHPRFTALGGGEKVVEALAALYPQADIFVLSSVPQMVPPTLQGRCIRTSPLAKIPGVRKVFEKSIVLYPLAVESWDLSKYDLIISSAGPAVFGVRASHALHICYCHSPERSWWDQYSQRQNERSSSVRRLMYKARASYIRSWEYRAAQRVDYFVANSRYISQRIRRYFDRDSAVIYPSVDTSRGYIDDNHDDYFLYVGRLTAAKRVDLLIEACNRLNRRLVIAGTGPLDDDLRSKAGPSIEFRGFVSDHELPSLYAKCRAFLFAADEDFGIAPVEAQCYGRPVIAYAHGGSLETVRVDDPNGRPNTGIFFAHQSAESVADGILRFEQVETSFSPEEIQEHAKQFDTSVFMNEMLQFVDDAISRGNENHG